MEAKKPPTIADYLLGLPNLLAPKFHLPLSITIGPTRGYPKFPLVVSSPRSSAHTRLRWSVSSPLPGASTSPAPSTAAATIHRSSEAGSGHHRHSPRRCRLLPDQHRFGGQAGGCLLPPRTGRPPQRQGISPAPARLPAWAGFPDVNVLPGSWPSSSMVWTTRERMTYGPTCHSLLECAFGWLVLGNVVGENIKKNGIIRMVG